MLLADTTPLSYRQLPRVSAVEEDLPQVVTPESEDISAQRRFPGTAFSRDEVTVSSLECDIVSPQVAVSLRLVGEDSRQGVQKGYFLHFCCYEAEVMPGSGAKLAQKVH